MNEKIRTFFLTLIAILILIIAGFYLSGNKETNLKYQACLDKCQAQSCGFGSTRKGENCEGCRAECREIYGKTKP